MANSWIEELFGTFTQKSDVQIYFEDKEKLKIKDKVINLSIHPIRFADDIFFNFETNDIEIKQKIKKYEVDYNQFYFYAKTVKAHFKKINKHPLLDKNSLLLIGQTQMDKVIFDGHRYLSLSDFEAEIKTLSKSFDNIYLKPHPYSTNNKKLFKDLKRIVPNLKITQENIYKLLAEDNLMCVAGLNSSVLYEAKYFEKEVVFFYQEYFDFENNDIGVYNNYFDSIFWADILNIDDINIKVPFIQSRLRKIINDFWGYNEISDEIILKDILKTKIKYLLSKIV